MSASDSPTTRALTEFPARYARTARFTAGAPRTFTVIDGGRRVLYCRPADSGSNVLALWALDVASGEERIVIDPATIDAADGELPAAERARRERAREAASGVVAYSVDQAGATACCAIAGGLFIVDLSSGTVRAPEVEGTVFDPRLSPDGTAVAYIDGRSLRVVDAASGAPVVERLDPDDAVSHGRAEFIAAEEMSRGRGFWWSPDSAALLVARVDERPVDKWWIADPAHPDRTPTMVRYPAAGTANAIVGLELVGRDGSVAEIDWSDGGRYEYLADVAWSADRAPLAVRQTRDQSTVSIVELTLDGSTGTEVHQTTNDVWVELIAGSPTTCGEHLLTVEDSGNTRSLCVDGLQLTPDGLQVRSIVGIVSTDEVEGVPDQVAVVTAWLTPTDIGLVAVGIDCPSKPTRACVLTPGDGVRSATMAGDTAVVVTAEPNRAGNLVEVCTIDPSALAAALAETTAESDVADGSSVLRTVTTITGNEEQPGFAADPHFTVLGARELQSAVFLPSEHDGASPLPVLLDPYGGPHAQRVLKAHNPHLVSRWLAEQGYAVIVTDGRGTPGRGPQWEYEVHGDLAGPVLDDQLAALDGACEAYPFLDPERVGIRGWSFGGYLAALAVLRRPDRFHAAVAGAPVTTWHLYDTHYTERYLGHPDEHPEHYRTSDLFVPGEPITLQRPLLLVHGLADDNVVAAHTLRLSTELLAAGCPHEVLPLSGVTHMTPQEAVAANLLRLQLDFFDRHLGSREQEGSDGE